MTTETKRKGGGVKIRVDLGHDGGAARGVDLAGRRFGRLLVQERVNRPGKTHWKCLCDCGKTLDVRQSRLLDRQQSCGCALTETFDPQRRFWGNVQKRSDGDCWVWNGYFNSTGYGFLNVDGRKTLAHRYSFLLHKGPIPDGLHVLHKCDNPPCTNPDHLFLGTNQDNIADRVAKGRSRTVPLPRGEHPNTKLSVDQACEVRRIYRPGMGPALARQFGVSKTLIKKIANDQVPLPAEPADRR